MGYPWSNSLVAFSFECDYGVEKFDAFGNLIPSVI
jgi:hypothetical protein